MHSRKQVHQVAVQFSKQIFSFQAVIGCSKNSCQPSSSSCTNDDNDTYKDPYHDGQQQLKLLDSYDPAFIQACHALGSLWPQPLPGADVKPAPVSSPAPSPLCNRANVSSRLTIGCKDLDVVADYTIVGSACDAQPVIQHHQLHPPPDL